MLVGLLAAAYLSWSAPRTYSSSTQLFVSVTATADTTDPLGADSFSQQRAVSYVRLLTGTELAQRVVDELDLPLSAAAVAGKVRATPLPGTVVLQVEVTDSTPGRAQAITASLARQFTTRVTELETPDGATTPTVAIDTIEPATFKPTPISPAVRRNVMLGIALGLVAGLGLALLRHRMDRSVRHAADVREATGVELIGRVFEDRELAARHVSSGLDGRSPIAEAHRAIRVNLRHVDGDRPPQVIVVTGVRPDDGASTLAVNVAASLARWGSRVMLLDGDLRRPRVTRYLGLGDDGAGLSDVVAGSADLREASKMWGDNRLTVLGAGSLPQHTDAVLDSSRMRALLQVLRDTHEHVIIDAPPLLSVVDAAGISALADGCLLVARYGKTQHDDLAEAAGTLERVHARLLGVVLNRVPPGSAVSAIGDRGYPADPDRTATPPSDAQARRSSRRGSHSADRVSTSSQEPDEAPETGARQHHALGASRLGLSQVIHFVRRYLGRGPSDAWRSA